MISESSVYRILKDKGLITTPFYALQSASNEFKNKTQFVHELWQTDFTYFKILGRGIVIENTFCPKPKPKQIEAKIKILSYSLSIDSRLKSFHKIKSTVSLINQCLYLSFWGVIFGRNESIKYYRYRISLDYCRNISCKCKKQDRNKIQDN